MRYKCLCTHRTSTCFFVHVHRKLASISKFDTSTSLVCKRFLCNDDIWGLRCAHHVSEWFCRIFSGIPPNPQTFLSLEFTLSYGVGFTPACIPPTHAMITVKAYQTCYVDVTYNVGKNEKFLKVNGNRCCETVVAMRELCVFY